MRTRLDDLPRAVAKEVREVLAKEPELTLEAAVGEALRRRPELIRDWREWEREGRPSPAEKELKNQRGVLDRLRSDAVILGAQLEELRHRATRLYPPPQDPRETPRRPQGEGRESWAVPVRKSSAEDFRVSILENTIAELAALADTLTPLQQKVLNEVLNLLGQLAEELGGEKSRRRIAAMAMA